MKFKEKIANDDINKENLKTLKILGALLYFTKLSITNWRTKTFIGINNNSVDLYKYNRYD